jgi:uncharacterized membrane protein
VRFGFFQGKIPTIAVVDKFTAKGQDEPALLEVDTTASGGAADDFREQFATNTIEETKKSYLNFYAATYPRIESGGDLDIRDDTERNVITTVERYRVPGFWALLPDKRNYRAKLFPEYVYDLIPMPKTRIRTSPFAVEYPKNVEERIEVSLPEPWPEKEEAENITTAAFQMKTRYVSHDSTVVLDYQYNSVANGVSMEAVQGYNEQVKDIDLKLGYDLTWQAQSALRPGPVDSSVMVIMVLSALLLAMAAFGGYRLAIRPAGEITAAVPTTVRPELAGLGGWLVLVAIGLFLRPVTATVALRNNWSLFSSGNWYDLTNPAGARFNPLWAPYLLYVIIGNLTIIAASVLLTVMFFQRRRRFPVLYVIFLGIQATLLITDAVFNQELSIHGAESIKSDASLRSVAQAVVGAAIWIPYMLTSIRVKSTFQR